ncbi:MAG: MFS transporter [Nitrososphaerales archaeon]
MSLQIAKWGRTTFASLGVRNYRLYFIGQMISQSGTFMQQVAQAWLVLKLTNSGTALGLIAALQNLPVLLFAPLGGALADRFPKRTLLLWTQTAFGFLALLLGALVIANVAQLWMVAALAFAFGIVNCIDNPTRQSFVVEMVGPSQLRNAVSLNSTMFNLSRIIGPALAGVLIAVIGMAPCFILNGLSYAAVIVTLLLMEVGELYAAVQVTSGRGQIAEGFRYAFSTPVVRNVLLIMAVIGTLTYEFQVSLPLLAEFTFQGNASAYAALSSALGIGAVIGGLVTASRKSTSFNTVVVAALLFGLTALLAAFMPTLTLAVAAVVVLGFCSIYFSSTANTTVQLASDPQMRGRVMALWAMAVLGSTTIGGPVIGFIGQQVSARWALATGGAAAVAAAAFGIAAARSAANPRRQTRGRSESRQTASD